MTSSGSTIDILYLLDGEKVFLDTAKSFDAVTDKVRQHSYQEMYGQFLLPYAYKFPKMKMLEIGLGCMIEYGPGASVSLSRSSSRWDFHLHSYVLTIYVHIY